jgi:hypothetical protein
MANLTHTKTIFEVKWPAKSHKIFQNHNHHHHHHQQQQQQLN